MTYKFENYLNSLFSLQRRGIKLGLEHTKNLLKFFDNPHEKFLTIHVAGTNGKGSTCAYIERILRYSGYKVGIYTSPHLFNFNERIRVDGIPISDKEIVSFLDKGDVGILEGYVNLRDSRSFYNKYGYIFSYVIIFISLLMLLIVCLRSRKV